MTRKLTLGALMAAMALGASAAAPMTPTTVTDGEFAADTQWFTMQIAQAGYYIHDNGSESNITLRRTTSELTDEDLWCLVGSDAQGYTLYNRKAGAGKSFAAPSSINDGNTGGSTYPTLKEPGKSGQCYLWEFTSSSNLSMPSYYVSEKGNSNYAINNRGNILAFWTSGKDGGSSVVFSPVTAATVGAVSGNSVDLGNGVSLQGPSAPSVADGVITLGEGTWTFVVPEGKVVKAFSAETASGVISGANPKGYFGKDPSIEGPATLSNLRYQLIDGQEEPPGQVIFRYDGTPGYNVVYRIPTITTVMAGPHKGRLVAINDYRYSGVDIGSGRIDLYMAYSDDNGATWTEPDHMRNANGTPVAQGTGAQTPAGTKGVETNLDCGFGDPASVSDRETGEILVVSCCGRKGFWAGRRDDPQPSARWWSSDGGQTWTEPDYGQWEQIYSLLDGTCVNGYIDSQFVGSGRMVQSSRIKVGTHYRIYCVNSGYHAASGNVSNWVFYSDDFGKNWHILGDPMTPPVTSGADEPKCEELPDGSILLAARGNGGNRNFNIFRYTDLEKAEGYWGQSINTNLGFGSGINACNGEIMIVPARNKTTGQQAYLALQSYPKGPGRSNVSIAWKVLASSEDYDEVSDFATWNDYYQVSKLSSAYSTMTWQADNVVGFLYEEERVSGYGYCEVYRRLPIEEITKDAWEYFPDEDKTVARTQQGQFVSALLEKFNEKVSGSTPVANVVGAGELNPAGIASVQAAAEAYNAEPTDENYAAFLTALNAAQNDYLSVLLPEAGKKYTFISAHGGLAGYPTKTTWMTVGSTGCATTTRDSNNYREIELIAVEGETDKYILHCANPARDRYLQNTPAATATVVPTTANIEEAGTYHFDIANGTVAIVCDNPGNATYPAIHLDSSNRIVIWTVTAAASRWTMTLSEDQDGIHEISADTVGEQLYDLQGRRVEATRPGEIVLTSKGRKIRL